MRESEREKGRERGERRETETEKHRERERETERERERASVRVVDGSAAAGHVTRRSRDEARDGCVTSADVTAATRDGGLHDRSCGRRREN